MLVVSDITKSFGKTHALRGVSLSASAGEIVALVGQNGAGKSTLMNLLAGVFQPDSGQMLLEGQPFCPQSPLDARRAGIVMVHQELSICPHLTVAENVLLGSLPTRFGLIDWPLMQRRARELLEPLTGKDTPIDPLNRVSNLSLASQQIVEIARALGDHRCRVLILDEPTSSLTAHDTQRLFAMLTKLKQQGLSLIYSSHFLEEVKAIADRVVVLRDGQTVGEGQAETMSVEQMVRLMVGRPMDRFYCRSPHTPGQVVLETDALGGKQAPRSATLQLHRGEVLGIAGLLGAGRTELLRVLFGLDSVRAGKISVLGYVGPASPTYRLGQGVGLVSEDRQGEGLCLGMSLADNLTLSRLGHLGKAGLVLANQQEMTAAKWIKELGIRCQDPWQRVSQLSGGNQQKVAMARLLHHDVDVFLLDEPTRGIDVESKAQIYALIDAQANKGKAVLMVSSYMQELLGVCDRIQVMQRGVLGPSRNVSDLSEEQLLLEAGGERLETGGR